MNRATLFDSTVRKELVHSFGATLMVLLTLVVTIYVMRTLGLAANGDVSPEDLVLVFAFLLLGNVPIVLALSLFIAVVVSLGRMYRQSEMAIWFSSGVGLSRFVRPVLATGWPVLAAIAVLTLVAWPWSVRESNVLRQRFERRSDVLRAAPGQFQSSSDGRRVIFVEKVGSQLSGGGRNLFVMSDAGPKESVATAQSGRLENDGEDRILILDSGHLQQVDKATGDHIHVEFEHYRAKVGASASGATDTPSPPALDTADLVRLGGAANLGEMAWRLGLILGAANLMLLGIGLSANDPRRASNWSLLFALLAFVCYYNMLNLSRASVASGKVNIVVALAGVHGMAFVVALGMLWWRDYATVVHPVRLILRRLSAKDAERP